VLEAANVALMPDNHSKIVLSRILARRACRTIREGLLVGVGVVHVLGMTAALAGWIGLIRTAMLRLGQTSWCSQLGQALRVDLAARR
jgi:cation transport ATPase